VENTHEPLVSREAFQHIQELRAKTNERAREIQANTIPFSANVFGGKVLCAQCGRPLHRHRQNKDGTYWFRCESQWKYGKDTCTVVSVKESELKSEILAMLHKHAEAVLGHYIAAKKEAVATDTRDAELREINQGMDRDGRMLKSLYESMVSGLITKEEFVRMKADYEAKIKALSRRADELRNRRAKIRTRASEYAALADAVSEAVANDALTADIISRLVQAIYVSPDKSFHVQFRFKDEYAAMSSSAAPAGGRLSPSATLAGSLCLSAPSLPAGLLRSSEVLCVG
jgi:hypothetical protein